MTQVASEIVQLAIGLFFDIIDVLISLLPLAPFRSMLTQIEGIDVLGYVNYFIPFQFCAQCINAWLLCVIAYYVYKYLKQAFDDYRARH